MVDERSYNDKDNMFRPVVLQTNKANDAGHVLQRSLTCDIVEFSVDNQELCSRRQSKGNSGHLHFSNLQTDIHEKGIANNKHGTSNQSSKAQKAIISMPSAHYKCAINRVLFLKPRAEEDVPIKSRVGGVSVSNGERTHSANATFKFSGKDRSTSCVSRESNEKTCSEGKMTFRSSHNSCKEQKRCNSNADSFVSNTVKVQQLSDSQTSTAKHKQCMSHHRNTAKLLSKSLSCDTVSKPNDRKALFRSISGPTNKSRTRITGEKCGVTASTYNDGDGDQPKRKPPIRRNPHSPEPKLQKRTSDKVKRSPITVKLNDTKYKSPAPTIIPSNNFTAHSKVSKQNSLPDNPMKTRDTKSAGSQSTISKSITIQRQVSLPVNQHSIGHNGSKTQIMATATKTNSIVKRTFSNSRQCESECHTKTGGHILHRKSTESNQQISQKSNSEAVQLRHENKHEDASIRRRGMYVKQQYEHNESTQKAEVRKSRNIEHCSSKVRQAVSENKTEPVVIYTKVTQTISSVLRMKSSREAQNTQTKGKTYPRASVTHHYGSKYKTDKKESTHNVSFDHPGMSTNIKSINTKVNSEESPRIEQETVVGLNPQQSGNKRGVPDRSYAQAIHRELISNETVQRQQSGHIEQDADGVGLTHSVQLNVDAPLELGVTEKHTTAGEQSRIENGNEVSKMPSAGNETAMVIFDEQDVEGGRTCNIVAIESQSEKYTADKIKKEEVDLDKNEPVGRDEDGITSTMGKTISSHVNKCSDLDNSTPQLIGLKCLEDFNGSGPTKCDSVFVSNSNTSNTKNCECDIKPSPPSVSENGVIEQTKTSHGNEASSASPELDDVAVVPLRRKSILKKTSCYGTDDSGFVKKPFHLNRQTWKVGSEIVLLRDERVSQKLELRRSRVMSRRASLFAKQNPGKPRVRFPDELVFQDNIKENDIAALTTMLRRASLKVNINGINSAGLTPLHQAVLDGNLNAVVVLLDHGSDINVQDEDTWTPLHAACADGQSEIVKYLLEKGADRNILTEEGERPIDLVDPSDLATISIMLASQAGQGQFESSEEEESDDDEDSDDDDEEEDDDDDDGDDDDDDDDNNKKDKASKDDDSDEDDDDDDFQYSSFNISKLKKVDGSEIKSSSKKDDSDSDDSYDYDDDT